MRKYHWYSSTTGEIVESFYDVVRTVLRSLFVYHFIDLRWRYNVKGW